MDWIVLYCSGLTWSGVKWSGVKGRGKEGSGVHWSRVERNGVDWIGVLWIGSELSGVWRHEYKYANYNCAILVVVFVLLSANRLILTVA